MRFFETLVVVLVASLAMTACADEGRAIAQDLNEIRQQIGSPNQASADAFQQAVRDVAKGEQTRDAPDFGNWVTPSWGQGPRNFGSPINNRQVGPANWSDARHPQYHPQPVPTPASRLRETAFQLDRLAHELEMAELYKGADTLRGAAGRLRKSARQASLSGQDGPAIAPPSPAGKSLPK